MSRAAQSAIGTPQSPAPASPLPSGQHEALDALARALAPDALLWASGYLAGFAAQSGASGVAAAPKAAQAQKLAVYYATETGNSRQVADDLVAQAHAANVSAQAFDLRDTKVAQLKKDTHVAFVVATHGLGDAPDGTEDFFEALAGKRAPDLSHLSYAVLALGDSSYDDFCQVGADLDQRLAQLGATRRLDRVDCDVDFASDAAKWAGELIARSDDLLAGVSPAPVALRAVPNVPAVSRAHPATAQVLVNQRITSRDSSKVVHHIELGVEVGYEPGDALGVVIRNPAAAVDPVLAALGATGAETVTLGEETRRLDDALTTHLDITASGRRFAEHYAGAAGQRDLEARLASLGSDARGFFWRHQVVDLLREFPGDIAPQAFVDGLRALQPRLYSIASSPHANPDEVHLTVARVGYEAFGHAHVGSASTALTDATDNVDVYVAANPHFRLPEDPDAPVLMIGPGTGIAPFRAFLEHRAEHGAGGDNWLFFGDRTLRHDFLYQLELQRHLKRGTLARLDVAFSRDQAEKVYVQDRLRERAREVVRWLDDGAHVYVCGDAERMAPDVHDALRDVIRTVRGVSAQRAEDELKALKRDHRYQKDVY